MCIQFRECTCHLLRTLSVTQCGLHWLYMRLCMQISCRSKTQLNKSHTGLRLFSSNSWVDLNCLWLTGEVYWLCLNPEYWKLYINISCRSVSLQSDADIYKFILWHDAELGICKNNLFMRLSGSKHQNLIYKSEIRTSLHTSTTSSYRAVLVSIQKIAFEIKQTFL